LGKNIFSFNKTAMLIQHRQDGNRGIYYIEEDSNVLAEIVYANADDNKLMIIEHTEVDEVLRGKNIGYELVHKAVEHARIQGQKVAPICPFAKAIIDKKPEFQDVLAK
jgi:predicted GNAT family acetyltransferase